MAQQTPLQKAILAWFQSQGRSLPWRQTRDPYAILVAEVMLQQTQVERVVPKYLAFLAQYPTLEALARAPTAEVIRAWAGLGYNRRALHLQRAARAALEQHGGRLPRDPEALRRLDGIGPYTAAAVACFAHGRQLPVLDTNVKRVLGRLLIGPQGSAGGILARLAQEALPRGRAWAWNQALMDLGAALCTSRQPRCAACPARAYCHAAPHFLAQSGKVAEPRAPYRAAASPYQGSSRYYRGRIVARLRETPVGAAVALPSLGAAVKPSFTAADLPWLLQLLQGLQRDGLVSLAGELSAEIKTGPAGEAGGPEQVMVSLPRG
jgi:A/G-specific adenine glycosylase